MKTISSTAIVALMAATLGLSALAPAYAQEAAPAPQAQPGDPAQPGEPGMRPGGPGMRHAGGMGDFLGFERGAEAVEIAIVRLSYRLDLTDAQKGLLETLRTTAVTAATDFATATEGLRPTPPAEGETATAPTAPDFSKHLENRIAMEKAKLAALESVQPALTAFFDSLTDEQKASLVAERGPEAGDRGPGNFGKRDGGPGFGGQRHEGHRDGGPRHDGQGPGEAGPRDDAGAPPAPPAGDAPAPTDAPAPAAGTTNT